MTTRRALAALLTTTFLSFAGGAVAQDTGTQLPDICQTGAMAGMGMANPNAGAMGSMSPMAGMDEGHQMMAAGMDQMNANMMLGMTASDIDVAFVCGMIPHHQGAIAMAKAELANGDDPWAKELAQKVIDAQTQEIADMIAWLDKQPK